MWARALSLVSKQHEEERPKPKGFAGLAAQASAQQRAGLLQASGSRDAEDGEEPIPEEVAELVQEYSVVLEYERIQDLIPRGIYLVPSFDSRAEWHGIVCLRGGFWKGASFKFKILLGEDYPGKPPEIYFASELYHPAVCARTWRFQTEAFFPAWQEGRDYLACVLPFFYRALRHQRHFVRLSGAPPLNPDAFQLLKSDPEAFATRAAADAQRSADVAYDNAPGFALEFARNPACTERILERLDVNPKLRPDVQAQSFADWFCDHYAAEQQKAEKREKHELEEIHREIFICRFRSPCRLPYWKSQRRKNRVPRMEAGAFARAPSRDRRMRSRRWIPLRTTTTRSRRAISTNPWRNRLPDRGSRRPLQTVMTCPPAQIRRRALPTAAPFARPFQLLAGAAACGRGCARRSTCRRRRPCCNGPLAPPPEATRAKKILPRTEPKEEVLASVSPAQR
eukprot:TRINITY_DN14894_c0_g1_i1.p1 TRINITY_DN14894_c0_g1~~TRINITY_DN14894_c0_g1_i1.p1  ORF type:complete len:453 (-),score=71.51 TRINITY_DN14894_c0_g1_i1:200-1558(-)